MSGGESMVARRRVELDMYFAADKEIPTFYRHECHTEACLLNLVETYNGSSNQIRAIEYLEKKFKELDPSGKVLRRFFRYWNEKPSGLGSPKRAKVDLLDNSRASITVIQVYNFQLNLYTPSSSSCGIGF